MDLSSLSTFFCLASLPWGPGACGAAFSSSSLRACLSILAYSSTRAALFSLLLERLPSSSQAGCPTSWSHPQRPEGVSSEGPHIHGSFSEKGGKRAERHYLQYLHHGC